MIIGIIGGGQLAKMMVLAGYPMGQEFIILDPAEDAAAGRVAKQLIGNFDDPAMLDELAKQASVVTFDFENVPAAAVEKLAEKVDVFPSADVLAHSQDRCKEKSLFQELDIPTAPFASVDNLQELEAAIETIGLPAVLKTRRLGYDGKGQYRIKDKKEVGQAWQTIGEQPAILEAFVEFEREVSIIAVRSRKGELAFYPLVHNVHRDGILHLSQAPYQDSDLQKAAEKLITPILQRFNFVGVLALECFVKDGKLLANEMAPRVHNTGHWTIEGAGVSQFENHLRAICGLPLGATDIHSHAAMINFISELPPAEAILAIPGCHFHDYGKKPRPGRKVGHATLRASTEARLQEKIEALSKLID